MWWILKKMKKGGNQPYYGNCQPLYEQKIKNERNCHAYFEKYKSTSSVLPFLLPFYNSPLKFQTSEILEVQWWTPRVHYALKVIS